MSKFKCTACGAEVSYSELDTEFFRRMEWRCMFCIKIISEHKYPVNITKGKSVFASIGRPKTGVALGDNVVFEVIKRKYLEDNPDETVIFLDPDDDHYKKVSEIKPDKYFVSEFCGADGFEHKQRYYYNAMNDICEYAKQGVYPRLTFEAEEVKPGFQYNRNNIVVMHIRNIEKVPEKPYPKRNFNPELALQLIDFIRDKGLKIVIVGNDRVDDNFGMYNNVHDFRNKLTLPKIAWLLKNCRLYVGRDSGMLHVAAACGARIVSFAHQSMKWFPKCPPENYVSLFEWDTNYGSICQKINVMLNQ